MRSRVWLVGCEKRFSDKVSFLPAAAVLEKLLDDASSEEDIEDSDEDDEEDDDEDDDENDVRAAWSLIQAVGLC